MSEIEPPALLTEPGGSPCLASPECDPVLSSWLKEASPFLLGREKSFKLQMFLCFLRILVTWSRAMQLLILGSADDQRGRLSAGS